MVSHRALVDGENEVVTITSIRPMRAPGGTTYWLACGSFDGVTMELQVWPEDQVMFQIAGYTNIFQPHATTRVNIEAVTRRDERRRWRVSEVYPSADMRVLSSAERIRDYAADNAMWGEPTVIGEVAVFMTGIFTRATWKKLADGRYTRRDATGCKVYEAKVISAK